MAFEKNKIRFKNSLLNRLTENTVKSIENSKFCSAVQDLFCTVFCIYVYFLLCYIVLVLTKAKGENHMTSAQIIIVVTIVPVHHLDFLDVAGVASERLHLRVFRLEHYLP